ncbi:MAG: magnesium transporter [Candidatus Omnitrophica bacterium]|nr:magnesium transporter [Candidatus Omnitrophota bacterium]
MSDFRDDTIKNQSRGREERAEEVARLLEEGRPGSLSRYLKDKAPEDIAEILGEFSLDEKLVIFNGLSAENAAVVLDDTDPQTRLQLLQKLDSKRLAEVLEEMPVDEAADIIEDAPEDEREDLLDLMGREDAEEVEEILSYPEDSAARVMNPEFVTVREYSPVEDAVQHLRNLELEEDIFYIYVTDKQDRLKGIVPVTKLVTARSGTRIDEIMDKEVRYVVANEDQEQAANIMKKYDIFSLPVVDADEKLIGRITADDIIDVMDEERGEDISKMTGTIEEEQGTESVIQATKNRLPWLVTCMLGSIVTGLVIRMFEVTLAETIALVSFIPVITATGGNSGVQASTVVVREIALGHMDMGKVGEEVWRQFRVAAGLGIVCGTVLTGIADFWMKSSAVGTIVGLSILLVVVWSNFVGVMIPVIFKKLRIDPAISSGPLITTLNDVIGVFIYLSVASFFLK